MGDVSRPDGEPATAPSDLQTEPSDASALSYNDRITSHNATQSPFLNKLPAELRIKIYKLALGNNIVHVAKYPKAQSSDDPEEEHAGPASSAHHGVACDGTQPSERDDQTQAEQRIFCSVCPRDTLQSLEEGTGRWPHHWEHARWVERVTADPEARYLEPRQCYVYGSECELKDPLDYYNMSLLYTCRQIYSEARLLPFSENMFTFYTQSTLQSFVVDILSAEQASKLANVFISVCINGTTRTDPLTWSRLAGVDTLTLHIDLFVDDDDDYDDRHGKWEAKYGIEEEIRAGAGDWLPGLEHMMSVSTLYVDLSITMGSPADGKTLYSESMSGSNDAWVLLACLRQRICPGSKETERIDFARFDETI